MSTSIIKDGRGEILLDEKRLFIMMGRGNKARSWRLTESQTALLLEAIFHRAMTANHRNKTSKDVCVTCDEIISDGRYEFAAPGQLRCFKCADILKGV